MSSQHNTTLNFSHAPHKNKNKRRDVDLEIKMGEYRLRYIQLMRDAHSTLGDKNANILIKEAEAIWEQLSNPKSTVN